MSPDNEVSQLRSSMQYDSDTFLPSVACCRSPRDLGYTLTCIDADGAMHMMQIRRSLNALHPFSSFLPAPCSEQGQWGNELYPPTPLVW